MKAARARLLSLVFVLAAGAASLAAEPRVQRDIPYAQPVNDRQTLDVYSPADGRNHPIVIWIHGGGWSTGSKKDVFRKPQAFTDQGYVFVAINYRLQPVVTIREITGDVAKAIRWIHDHAPEYGGDPERIVVMGHSAGGQLAALICTDESYLKTESLTFANLKACVPVDGRYWMGQGREDLSPAVHVGKAKGIPPFLVLHAAKTPDEAQRFVKLLQAADVSAKTYPAEGKDHTSINEDLGRSGDPATEELFDFMTVVFKR